MTDWLLPFIKQWEGYSAVPYICSAGYWTVGWGSTWDLHGQRVTALTSPVDVEVATALLEREVEHSARAVRRLVPVPLAEYEFEALCSFVYNLGAGALQASTLRAMLRRGEREDAPAQFLRWIYAGGRPSRGLLRRRSAEARHFSGGD